MCDEGKARIGEEEEGVGGENVERGTNSVELKTDT